MSFTKPLPVVFMPLSKTTKINVTIQEANMFGLGTTELIIILVIVVVLFGASKLPQIGKGIGEAISNFKKATSGLSGSDEAHNVASDKTGNNKGTNAG